jgi:preprotein translocase subunit SecD
VTTLVAALFLFGFGSGPIKGFAVTLTIGIVVSMFTAVFVTRIVFDQFVWNRKIQKISI